MKVEKKIWVAIKSTGIVWALWSLVLYGMVSNIQAQPSLAWKWKAVFAFLFSAITFCLVLLTGRRFRETSF